MVYMSKGEKDCGAVSEKCYDGIGNVNKKIIFTPKTEAEETIFLMVKALDNCEFTLSLI